MYVFYVTAALALAYSCVFILLASKKPPKTKEGVIELKDTNHLGNESSYIDESELEYQEQQDEKQIQADLIAAYQRLQHLQRIKEVTGQAARLGLKMQLAYPKPNNDGGLDPTRYMGSAAKNIAADQAGDEGDEDDESGTDSDFGVGRRLSKKPVGENEDNDREKNDGVTETGEPFQDEDLIISSIKINPINS